MVTFSKFLENFAVGKTNSIAGSGPSAAKIGVLQLRDLDGSIIGTYNYVNGGYGRGYIPAGEYRVLPQEPVRPNQYDAMSRDGVAYKFPVALNNGSTIIPDRRVESIPTEDNPQGGPRDGIMIHPDGGTKGTMGCIGIQGNGQVQRDFYEKLNYLIKRNNGFYPLKFDTSESSIGPEPKSEELPEQPSSEPSSEPTEKPQQASLSTKNNNVAQAFTPSKEEDKKEETSVPSEEVSKQADEIANTIKDWDWNAAKPSPQTGKFYPEEKQFSDGSKVKTLSDMMDDNLRIKPEYKQDFDKSVVSWLKDLIATTNGSINNLKNILKIKDNINAKNKQLYADKVNAIANTLSPQIPVAKAFTEPGSNQSTEQPVQVQPTQSVNQPSIETNKQQQVIPQTTGGYKHKVTLDLINKLNEVK